ncbi:hypothetical protein WAI453_004680 [Rhynchosporium graminicola]
MILDIFLILDHNPNRKLMRSLLNALSQSQPRSLLAVPGTTVTASQIEAFQAQVEADFRCPIQGPWTWSCLRSGQGLG